MNMIALTREELAMVDGGDGGTAVASAGVSVMKAGVSTMKQGSWSETVGAGTNSAGLSVTYNGTWITGVAVVALGATMWVAGEMWHLA